MMEKGQTAPSCSIEGFLATEKPLCLLLRRGPTKWFQLILWHTDTDTFEAGQWFHGKIYSGYCDLSPNGSLFMYVALKNQTPERVKSSYTYKWTAISKPPYFTALALWPLGENDYGGGAFLSNRSLWLYNETKEPHPDHRPSGLHITANLNAENLLLQSHSKGWELAQEGKFSFERASGYPLGKGVTLRPYIWQKYHAKKRYLLVREVYRKANFERRLLHYMVDSITDRQFPFEDVSWIDWDQQGRLAFTRKGQLFVVPDLSKPEQVQLLADFTTNAPTPVPTPEWASHW